MIDYLKPEPVEDIGSFSVPGLAHVGDAVYELMVRTRLCLSGVLTAKRLHDGAVGYVSARAQAEAAEKLLPMLTEEELSVFKRGRNAHTHSSPRNAAAVDYHAATGLEALFGYMYLKGETERLGELFRRVIGNEE